MCITSKEFELSQRYLLTLTDRGYAVYLLKFNYVRGVWARAEPEYFSQFEQAVEYLMHCELSQEDCVSLADVVNVLRGIRAELNELKCYARGASCF